MKERGEERWRSGGKGGGESSEKWEEGLKEGDK